MTPPRDKKPRDYVTQFPDDEEESLPPDIPLLARPGTWPYETRRYLAQIDNPRTRYEYHKMLGYFFEHPGMPEHLGDLTYEHLQGYRAKQAERTKRGRASVRGAVRASGSNTTTALMRTSQTSAPAETRITPGTFTNTIKPLRSFFKWAKQEGLLEHLDGLRMLGYLKPMKATVTFKYDVLPESEFLAFLAAADTPSKAHIRRWGKRPSGVVQVKGDVGTGARTHRRDYALVLLMFTTGLRAAEACAIDVRDLERERDLVTGEMRWRLNIPAFKSKGEYGAGVIGLAPRTMEVLEGYLASEGRTLGDLDTPLFRSEHVGREGEHRLGAHQIGVIFERVGAQWVARGGDPRLRITPHSARHSFATWLRRGNPATGRPSADPEEVRKLMRHTNIANTQKYFDHDERATLADRFTISPPG